MPCDTNGFFAEAEQQARVPCGRRLLADERRHVGQQAARLVQGWHVRQGLVEPGLLALQLAIELLLVLQLLLVQVATRLGVTLKAGVLVRRLPYLNQ